MLVHDDLSGLMAVQRSALQPCPGTPARPVVASQFLSEVSGLPGHFPIDRGEEGITPLHGMRWLTVHIDSRQEVHGAELLGEGSKLVRG